jgi:methyl-accepting chemotaxis protein
LKLGKQIGAGFGVVLAAMAVSAVVVYPKVTQMTGIGGYIVETRVPNMINDYELAMNLELTQTRSRDVILANGDRAAIDKARQSWEKQWAAIDEELAKAQANSVHSVLQANRDRVAFAVSETPKLRQDQAKLFAFAAEGSAEGIKLARDVLYTATKPRTDAIKAKLAEMRDTRVVLMNKEGAALQSAGRSVILSLVLSFAVALVIGVAVAFFLARRISTATLSVLGQAQAIAAGDLTRDDLKVRSKDELGDLTTAINKMSGSLKQMILAITDNATHVASAAEELNSTSQQITANSEETSAQADVVSKAAQTVSQNLQTVATGAEEMGASIKEIAKNATEAARVATSAVKVAETTTVTVSKLGDSSTEIGQVIKVITSIAQQTNLLALNATIEAARAGEAGKGFAVVANEVKELAKETAKATEDISRKIEAIQTDTKAAVDAIASISGVINQISDISSTIATAVEEQNATTNEMSRNVSEAAQSSGEITSNMTGMTEAAQGTTRGATDTQKASQQLVETSGELRRLVEQFKINAGENGAGAMQAQSRAAYAGS